LTAYGVSGLYGDMDMVRVMFGENAVSAPAWMYVQGMDDGTVGLVGASRIDSGAHPLRYGSDRAHQLIVGEIIVRPRVVVATDALRGHGANGLFLGPHGTALADPDNDVLIGAGELLRKIREQAAR
jgi:hypothetical protein